MKGKRHPIAASMGNKYCGRHIENILEKIGFKRRGKYGGI